MKNILILLIIYLFRFCALILIPSINLLILFTFIRIFNFLAFKEASPLIAFNSTLIYSFLYYIYNTKLDDKENIHQFNLYFEYFE